MCKLYYHRMIYINHSFHNGFFHRVLTEAPHHACALNIPICPTSTTIGLYRDVWIAAIASSRKSLVTQTAAICVRFSGATGTSRVRHNAHYVPYAQIRFDL